jgi:MFS family permease
MTQGQQQGEAIARQTRARAAHQIPLFALFSANTISMVGNVIAFVAVPWFVLSTTGSASRTGLAYVVTFLPTVVAGFFGGAIVDRLGFKRMSVIADLASGVTVALIPLLHSTVGLSFVALLALVFLGALLDAPGNTARTALLPDLAGAAGMRLERANALTQAIQRGSRLVGAPLAGLLIAAFGPSTALWLNAASFLISAAMVSALVASPPRVGTHEQRPPYLDELREGLAFVLRNPLFRALVGIVALTNFLDGPMTAALPVYADEVYGSATALGLMVGVSGGGAFASALLFGAVGHRWPRRGTFIAAFIAVCPMIGVLALTPPLWVAVTAHGLMGLAAGPINPVLATVFQERIPATMRGRVFGLLSSIALCAFPLGLFIGGFLVEWIGLRILFVLLCCGYFAVTLSTLAVPALREMNRTAAADDA